MPGLSSMLAEIAVSVPVLQFRLDCFCWAQLQAARDAIRQVQGTPAEPVARELTPARYIAHETTFEFELRTVRSSETEISVTLFNSFFSRRYVRQRYGSQKISATLRSAPILDPAKGVTP